MAFVYNELNSDFNGDTWADPTKGGTASGPITIATDGVVSTLGGSALALFDGAYKVTVAGIIASSGASSFGLHLIDVSQTTTSTVIVQASGSISGATAGLPVAHNLKLTNAGHIAGDTGIVLLQGKGVFSNSHVISNSGVIESFNNGEAIYMFGTSLLKFTNKGEVFGSILSDNNGIMQITNSGLLSSRSAADVLILGDLADKVTNSGTIMGNILLGDGADTLKNTGSIFGLIDLGQGNDIFTGGKQGETVNDGFGADNLKFGDGDDIFGAFGTGSADGSIDLLDGGKNALFNHATQSYGDIYACYDFLVDTTATSTVNINLDSKERFTLLAFTATGPQHNTDIVKNFESVWGSSSGDFIVGNALSNMLDGKKGSDSLYGGGGRDVLIGGDGSDNLHGEGGRDIMNSGEGATLGDDAGDGSRDLFVYAATTDSGMALANRDVIEFFEDTAGAEGVDDGLDQIRFEGFLALPTSYIGEGKAFSGGGNDGEIRAIRTGQGWTLQVDADGDMKVDMAIDVLDTNHSIVWNTFDFSFI